MKVMVFRLFHSITLAFHPKNNSNQNRFRKRFLVYFFFSKVKKKHFKVDMTGNEILFKKEISRLELHE